MGILDSMQKDDTGLVPRSIDYIFQYAHMNNIKMNISITFMQLYCENIHDLLSPIHRSNNTNNHNNNTNNNNNNNANNTNNTPGMLPADTNLSIREDPVRGFYVSGLQDIPVHSYAEAGR